MGNNIAMNVEPYLSAESEFEEKVEDAVGYPGAEGVLQIDLVTLEDLVGVLGAPPHHHPGEVVLDHGDGGVRQVPLFDAEAGVEIVAEFLRQVLDDDGTVGDLLAVELHEGQLALLRAVLHLVVHILEQRKVTM